MTLLPTGILRHIDRNVYRETINTKRWKDFLGDVTNLTRESSGRLIWEVYGDGNVFDHQRAQALIVKKYARFDIGSRALYKGWYLTEGEYLNSADYTSLRVISLTHDLGEHQYEDVCFDKKYMAQHTREQEHEAAHWMMKSVVSDPELLAYCEDNFSIDHDSSHKLHSLFKLYEKYSYINGLLIAFRSIGTPREVLLTTTLLHNVLKNQIDGLLKAYNAGIPSTVAFIDDYKEEISWVFTYVDNEIRKGFNPPIENDILRYKEACNSWNTCFSVIDA